MVSASVTDVVAPLAQRRHPDLDDIDAVVQVFAEFRFRDQVGEILVGRRQDTHVDGRFALLADGPHGFFLDHAQQLHLHVQRQVRDFIEEQCAAFGGLKQTGLVGDCAREAAALVAEEFAFHELGRNCAAVDRYERAFGAWTGAVDHAGNEFLARARFARDVHRRLAARHPLDELAQPLHGRCMTDELCAGACGRIALG